MEMIVLVGLGLLIAIGLGYLGSPTFKGKVGEARVSSAISRGLDPDIYRSYHDITLPSGDGTTQIDHLIVARFGLFVIETKNMQGWIFGSEKQSSWTQVIYGKKTKFQNPLRQNFKHVKAIEAHLGIPISTIHNVVVFSGSAQPKTDMPSSVLWNHRSLPRYVLSKQDVVFTGEQLAGMHAALESAALPASKATHKAHVAHVKIEITRRKNDPNACPKCSARMVERTNKKTGQKFLGCSRFPKCRGVRQVASA
ncbi:nuclease-related domain-containing protein [Pontivivens insulae]|uniref:NERD domain-containing protein n=1 Tax=Pontivivens insulae TaxID=1639689 RepID=A0A2R8ACP1_9RHOB|nr:NERD domain-containing protein [Pontivivens insulae]RED13915.1 topoisomerase-like DNA binding C4 zinc finger protein [Pontivivens insulae]SPF29989.1 hypothetical protein POI8812_02316 [Pontivivens insulae]